MKTVGMQVVSAMAQIGVAAVWPLVVCYAIYKFRDQLNRLLEALIGFVGRSCYCVGTIPDKSVLWTSDQRGRVGIVFGEDELRPRFDDIGRIADAVVPVGVGWWHGFLDCVSVWLEAP